MAEGAWRVGVDLGGSKTEVLLLDPAGKERHRRRTLTPGEGEGRYPAILDTVSSLVLEAAALIPPGVPWRVGVGIPGSVNEGTGAVQGANTRCLNGHRLPADLSGLLGRAVGVENDALCFALAEARAGAGRGYRTVFGVIMGSGCGGGLVVEGEPVRGAHGIAGEWGHLSVDPAGPPCWCGNRGCVETLISGGGLEAAARRELGRELSARRLVEEARQGEPGAARLFARFLEDFGRCLGGLISVLDPDAVVLGGGLSLVEELYREGADRARSRAFHPGIDTPVLKNALGDSAGALGAAWIGL